MSDRSDRGDDETVGDAELLLRRLLPDWIERDGAGGVRPKSLAFIDRRSGQLSVHRQELTTKDFVLRHHPTHGIAAFPAGGARAEGFEVIADPIANDPSTEDDPSHALVVPPSGMNPSRVKTAARKLALRADTLVIRDATTNDEESE